MTDKELKKLSRLELLEMLLEESKENEKLRDRLEKIKIENSTARSIENLSAATRQVDSILEQANSLTDTLRKTTREVTKVSSDLSAVNQNGSVLTQGNVFKPQIKEVTAEQKQATISDRNLYWRIMSFYAKNPVALNALPADIQKDIRARIQGILESRKKVD